MRRTLQILFWIAIANFAVFFVVTFFIGGDAFAGYIHDGHYFLGNKGKFTEVSRIVFLYSKWHVVSLFVTHPLGLICVLLLYKTPLGEPQQPRAT